VKGAKQFKRARFASRWSDERRDDTPRGRDREHGGKEEIDETAVATATAAIGLVLDTGAARGGDGSGGSVGSWARGEIGRNGWGGARGNEEVLAVDASEGKPVQEDIVFVETEFKHIQNNTKTVIVLGTFRTR
jgi:hypothetical protein